MKTSVIYLIAGLASASVLAGCASMPGGVAASTEPINGREYISLGKVSENDSRVYLLGLIPITGENTIQDAIDKAVDSKHGDAMVKVTVDSYSSYWILFAKQTTRVRGEVIRFSTPTIKFNTGQ